jgi:hypothetical protein
MEEWKKHWSQSSCSVIVRTTKFYAKIGVKKPMMVVNDKYL